jgi:hypothetical protein
MRDGARLVELAPIASADDVAAAIAAALGATPQTGETPEGACARFLAAQRGLLVIDNFEHLLGAAPLLSRLLEAAPGLVVLGEPEPVQRLDHFGVGRTHRGHSAGSCGRLFSPDREGATDPSDTATDS